MDGLRLQRKSSSRTLLVRLVWFWLHLSVSRHIIRQSELIQAHTCPIYTTIANSTLQCPGRRRDTHCDCLFGPLLASVVLPHRSSHRLFNIRLRLPHDNALLPLHLVLGPMDLRLRTLLHGHLQHPPLLLRHVRSFQRSGAPLQHDAHLLAILDVLAQVCFSIPQTFNPDDPLLTFLHQPVHILDRRRTSSHTAQHPRRVCRRGNRSLQRTTGPDLRRVCRRLPPTSTGLPTQSRGKHGVQLLSLLRGRRLPLHDQHQRERQMERPWRLPGVLHQ